MSCKYCHESQPKNKAGMKENQKREGEEMDKEKITLIGWAKRDQTFGGIRMPWRIIFPKLSTHRPLFFSGDWEKVKITIEELECNCKEKCPKCKNS